MKEKSLVEAALFMSSEPLTIEKLTKITGLRKKKVEEILECVKNELDVNSRGYELAITGGSYQFRVKDEYLEMVSSLTPHADLSDGMLRTLGLVALKQPVEQAEIVKIQGNKAYSYIKRLEDRGLLKGKKAGRTRKLSTTGEFERYFGRSLEEIKKALSKQD